MTFLLLSGAVVACPTIFSNTVTHWFLETHGIILPGITVLLSSRRNILRNSITKLNEKVRIMWFSGVESKSDDGHQTHCSVSIILMGLSFLSRMCLVI